MFAYIDPRMCVIMAVVEPLECRLHLGQGAMRMVST